MAFKRSFKNLKEYFFIAVKAILTRKIRSWLTILGVIIGVFLIVSLLSLSEGLKGAVMKQLSMMGKDLITVMPGGDFTEMIRSTLIGGSKLSEDDIRTIKKIEGVALVEPANYTSVVARYEKRKKSVFLYAANWKDSFAIYKEDLGWSLSQGRWPISGKNEILAGSLVSEEIFPGLKIGSEIVINGRKFQVVGILNSLGSKQDDSSIILDSNIFKSLTGLREGAQMALVKVKPDYSPDFVAEKIKKALNEGRKRKIGKGESETSFSVLTSEKISSIVGSIIGLIQAVIIGFASIAIIVGGIGIMNTMYTSVRERIKEIGIMKAIGAKNSTISFIFLIESGIFGLAGGVGGTILGILFAKAIEIYFQVYPMFYLKAEVGPGLIFFSLFFSFIVGCISGYLPSRVAAKMNPVDALRYE